MLHGSIIHLLLQIFSGPLKEIQEQANENVITKIGKTLLQKPFFTIASQRFKFNTQSSELISWRWSVIVVMILLNRLWNVW